MWMRLALQLICKWKLQYSKNGYRIKLKVKCSLLEHCHLLQIWGINDWKENIFTWRKKEDVFLWSWEDLHHWVRQGSVCPITHNFYSQVFMLKRDWKSLKNSSKILQAHGDNKLFYSFFTFSVRWDRMWCCSGRQLSVHVQPSDLSATIFTMLLKCRISCSSRKVTG